MKERLKKEEVEKRHQKLKSSIVETKKNPSNDKGSNKKFEGRIKNATRGISYKS